MSSADLSDWGVPNKDPRSVGSDGRTVADRLELLKECASMQFKQGKLPMAKQMYTEAIRLAPQTHTLYANRSAVACAAKDYVDALADANKCIELMPGWAKGYARRGAALHGMHRFNDAISSYERGLKMEPGLAILEQGIADVRKRQARAGGDWLCLADRKAPHKDYSYDVELIKCPTALCAAPNRGVCVIDVGHSRIRIFDEKFKTCRASFNDEQQINRVGLFGTPSGIACSETHLFISDHYNCRVLKCSLETQKLVAKIGGSGGLKGEFDHPSGLAIVDTSAVDWGKDEAGEQRPRVRDMLYVADTENRRVVAVDAESMQVRFMFGQWGPGDGEMMGPRGIAASSRLVAVADDVNYRVAVFTIRGEFVRNIGSKGSGVGQFSEKPKSVGMTEEHLFVTTEKGSKVHIFSPHTGEVLRPPMLPPWSTDYQGEGVLNGIGVFHDTIWLASGHAKILALPKEAAAKPAAKPPSESS